MSMHPPAWAEGFVGIPFAEKGRDRSGVDCWGAVRIVCQEHFGFPDLPDFGDTYTHTEDRESVAVAVRSGCMQGWDRVEKPRAGDVVILRLADRPWHCGVMLDEIWMLHAVRGANTVCERVDAMLWRRRIEGYYRYAI